MVVSHGSALVEDKAAIADEAAEATAGAILASVALATIWEAVINGSACRDECKLCLADSSKK